MLTDNAFTNSCCMCRNRGTLVKKSLYLSGFHQRYCLENKTYYNLDCTRLRYFWPVFWLIAVLQALRASVALSSRMRGHVKCRVIILSIFCHKWHTGENSSRTTNSKHIPHFCMYGSTFKAEPDFKRKLKVWRCPFEKIAIKNFL